MSQPIEDVIRLELPSNNKYLSMISESLKDLLSKVPNVDAQTIYNIQLAVQEACANIVDHAHKDKPNARIPVVMYISDAPLCITIELIDYGEPYDITQPPEVDLDAPHVRGYGLLIMHNLLDEIHYRTDATGNHWYLVKFL